VRTHERKAKIGSGGGSAGGGRDESENVKKGDEMKDVIISKWKNVTKKKTTGMANGPASSNISACSSWQNIAITRGTRESGNVPCGLAWWLFAGASAPKAKIGAWQKHHGRRGIKKTRARRKISGRRNIYGGWAKDITWRGVKGRMGRQQAEENVERKKIRRESENENENEERN